MNNLLHRRPAVAVLVCLGLLGLAGCYRTVELPGPVPAPGTRIVAELTPTGAERMAVMIGADAVGIEARVDGTVPDRWDLSLLRVEHRGSPSIQWRGEVVAFPADALRGTRERRLDARRTGALVGGVGVVAVILARGFMGGWLGGDDGGGAPPPVQ